jgi:hypothetical protein
MRFVRFVCLFAILISLLVLAQSRHAPLGNQPNGLPISRPSSSPIWCNWFPNPTRR